MISRAVRTVPRPIWFGGIALVVAILTAVLLTAIATEAPASPAVAAPAPTAGCDVLPLPTLGGLFGQVTAANRRGLAVGSATDRTGADTAVLWESGSVRPLSTGTAGSVAVSVNGRGDVVGRGRVDATPVGWMWSQGVAVRLKADRDEIAVPAAINDSGLIVGTLSENEGTEGQVAGQNEDEQAALWPDAKGAPVVLTSLPGDQGSQALAVNGRGQIGGLSAGARFRPVVWDSRRKAHALADLGGGYAAVRALADSGLAAGDAVAADGTDHPVLWDAAGRISTLELPAGARSGQATAILPDGTVIGTADVTVTGGGVQKQAVRWTKAGSVALLSTADGRAGSAAGGVADATSYVGYRTDPVGGRHPVLWRCGR
jgi:uncharacterized membrane protein